MPIDPLAAVNALIRAEVVRTGPDDHHAPGAAAPEPEPPESGPCGDNGAQDAH
ncbi:hypothetical protein [Streptomyces pacificus]|uniref:Uncharacterized protein n=1 Tax=Streptomyces pacificus TaxID=2705029 RepID=A0A6A0B5P9_9ACTN|nr:hypothetical protein [Streptomyces pacificus]GFH39007.1 hypothetical protein SCWH03_52720 [Streptomyces pacificus]